MPIHYILTDIEGTTTSVDFVFSTLFPYFLTHGGTFVQEHLQEAAVRQCLEATKSTAQAENQQSLDDDEAIALLMHWTRTDRKHPALKSLQGLVWRQGYERGELLGHIYPDVPEALQAWQAASVQMGVYSSGSVAAQKLIFGTSVFGNLTPYFSHYFDTAVGAKREVASYQHIQQQIQVPAPNILFLSDVEAELDAAAMAGYRTCQLVRAGTLASVKHPTAPDFRHIHLADF